MSIKRLRLSIFVLLLIVSGAGERIQPAVQAQDNAPPYIHFYDYLHHGLIIERADGTYSRLIPDLLPEEHNTLVWHGWSPSGRWFALGSYYSSGEPADYAHELQVVRTDGQVRLPLGPYYISGQIVSWAPQADVLLIFGSNALEAGLQARLIDVETGQELARAIFGPDYTAFPGDVETFWSSDGEHVYLFWGGIHLVTLHTNGQIAVSSYLASARQVRSGFFQGRLLYPERIVVDQTVTLALQDVETGQRITLEDQVGRLPTPYCLCWSPTLAHALIHARPCEDASCSGWLKLVDWAAGTITTLDTDNGPGDYCPYIYRCLEYWSPSGRYVVLPTNEREISVLDVHTGEITPVTASEEVAFYRWHPDERLYLAAKGANSFHVYDPATHQQDEIALPDDLSPGNGDAFVPSPDGQAIALSSQPPAIIDQSGAVLLRAISHSHSTASYPLPVGYTWHPTRKWIIADYVITFAGGGGGPTASVVFDVAGTVRRELPTGGEAGFVPEQAIPYLSPGQPASLKKDPILVLPQAGRVAGVGWHPTDPDRLVTYSEEDGLVFWSLANGQPEITDRIVPTQPYDELYPMGLKLFWLPEEDAIAFDYLGTLRQIDPATGASVPVNGVAYPMLIMQDNRPALRDAATGAMLSLNTDAALGSARYLTSGLDGLLVAGPEPAAHLSYIDTEGGTIMPLDITGDLWAADARDGIATFGNIMNCCVTIASTTTGRVIDRFYGTAYSLALSADGRRLATTSQGMIAIWDVSEYLVDSSQ